MKAVAESLAQQALPREDRLAYKRHFRLNQRVTAQYGADADEEWFLGTIIAINDDDPNEVRLRRERKGEI